MLHNLPQFLYDVLGEALEVGFGDFQWPLQPWSCCDGSACRGNGGWGCQILQGGFSDTRLSLHSGLPAALSCYCLVQASYEIAYPDVLVECTDHVLPVYINFFCGHAP